MRHDLLADMFCIIKNAETIGKSECLTPASKLIEGVLKVIQKHKYIGKFEHVEDSRKPMFRVELLGKVNDCNAIKPRFSANKDEFIKFEKRYLPASNVGVLILTTSKGIIDHTEAKKQNTGGTLLGYVY